MSKSFRNAVAFLFAVAVLSAFGANANAQRRGGFGQSDEFSLLRSGQVQEELDLMDDQKEQIGELEQEMRASMREMFAENRQDWSGKSAEERREMWTEIQAKMKSRMDEIKPKLSEVLLPAQQKRLSELAFQSQIQRSGGMLSERGSNVLKEKLNITDEQFEAMKKKAEEARKTFEAKVAKLRREAEAQVLSVLSEEQRSEYKALQGESFEFSNNRGRGGENGAGGRGGRGGENGAGGRGGRGGEGGAGGRGGRGGDRPSSDIGV